MKTLDKNQYTREHIFEVLGLGKTLFNSSICRFDAGRVEESLELWLTERLSRKKASGAWPSEALSRISHTLKLQNCALAQNRDVKTPLEFEERLNRVGPFYELLLKQGLDHFLTTQNPHILTFTHHRTHAYAAMAMSPYEKALIVVTDGAGSFSADFSSDHPEAFLLPQVPGHEACSVYLQDGKKLTPVYKEWQHFKQSEKYREHWFSQGLGTFYEKAAEYIFNSKRAAGKVMGLAALGKATAIVDRETYLENLDWSLAFKGKSKKEWEESGRFELFANVAASVQKNFEETVMALMTDLRKKYPDYKNLILAGGSSLNCTTNMMLVESGLFDGLYVPPFPGDESIGFGCAMGLYYDIGDFPWKPVLFENQHGYFGPKSSIPSDEKVKQVFSGYECIKPSSITRYTAELLMKDHVIAWFQGRSESGPRALGHRSILARVDRVGLKDHLNARVKFRESFRPYGCSVPHDEASHFFTIPEGFDNPYMSFATKVKTEWKDRLHEVTHADGTSRMQTVRPGQCPIYYELLKEFGRRSGLPILLNTSLNVMGEPIVETVEDARNFLEKTEVYGIAIGNYFIMKKAL